MVLDSSLRGLSQNVCAHPNVPYIKVALAIAVQNDWPLYHFDVKQTFVQAKLDTDDVYMKLTYCCGERTINMVKLDRALYEMKQAGRQWSAVLYQTLVDEHGIEQCRADPCVYRKMIVERVVKLIFVVHVDDILVSGKKETCDKLHHTPNHISRHKYSGS